MDPEEQDVADGPPSAARFPSSTHVWRHLAELRAREVPAGAEELAEVFQLYWRPVYGFLRRRGHARAEAEDLVQSFFLKLLEKGWVERACPEKGRFRTFLLTLLTRFVRDERELRQGRFERSAVSWEALHASVQPLELHSNDRPEDTYDRTWGQDLLARTWTAFETACSTAGHNEWKRALAAWLDESSEGRPSLDRIAATLGLGESASRYALDRAKKAYRECLRAEVRRTLPEGATEEEVDAEIAQIPGLLEVPW